MRKFRTQNLEFRINFEVPKRQVIKFIFLALFCLALSPLFTGCSKDDDSNRVDKIRIIQGDNQCALPESYCQKELKFELLGKQERGLFGGKGTRKAVSSLKVNFVPLKGSDLSFEPKIAISGAGGGVYVKIKTGKKTGDQYFAIVPENSTIKKTIRITSGVQILGANQEARAGKSLSNPLGIKLVDSDNRPIKGADVFFQVASTPDGKNELVRCFPSQIITDSAGIAEAKVMVGNATGKYTIVAEINDPTKNISYRGIIINELGINVFVLCITVLGGLSIFIFGMRLMSEGLQLVAGEKMKNILRFFTKNRLIAVAAGTIVTAVIQSSSACTVMVVGFVNAGLLNLTQAIGIVFGANIGTTVTAQMISFKLEGLSLPAIIIGAITMMCSRRGVIKGWGQTVFGFGLLFYGMMLMSNELKQISLFPSFVNFFNHFDCSPVNGYMPFFSVIGTVAIGTAMTLLIQSSSATIGIALALAMGGLINFYTAVPLILGDNIGTTVTALLASLGTNSRAKQTAVAHMLFNIFGALYMILLFYVPYPGTDIPIFLYFVNSITAGDVFAAVPENIARHIAMAHTMFNIFNVIIFLPFIGYIAKICTFIVKSEKKKERVFQILEKHLLKTPSIAILQSIASVGQMLRVGWKSIDYAINHCIIDGKIGEKSETHLMETEEEIDKHHMELTAYLIELTQKDLTLKQSSIIPLIMYNANDAEQIGDFSEFVFRQAKKLRHNKIHLSTEAIIDLKSIWKIVKEAFFSLFEYYDSKDEKSLLHAKNIIRIVFHEADKIRKSHIKRVNKGKCSAEGAMVYLEVISIIVKICVCLEDIAKRDMTALK